MTKANSKMKNGKLIWKLVVFISALGILALTAVMVAAFYKPQGEEDVRQQLETQRAAAMKITDEIEQLEKKLREFNAGEADDSKKINVSIKVLQPQPIQDDLVLPGIVEPYEDIHLAAKNDGPVEWLGVKEGDRVTKGQSIAKIDARVLIQTYRSAQAAEKLAEASFKRIKELFDKKVASQGELDEAQSALDQSRAATAIAKQNLDDATLYSPIDGEVDELPIDVGEFVNRGQTIARIVDVSRVKAVVNVPEKDVSYFREDQEALVQNPESHPGETRGRILRIGLVADPGAKTFPVEILIPNNDQLFLPGMINRVELVRRKTDDAIVISAFNALNREDGTVVYLEEDGIARMRPIEIGIRRGMEAEVVKGLKAGDRLIVKGQRLLTDGTSVKVVENIETR
ncbi:MAG: efflux RND transporter periplasmic adaptor subunit [Candidatus Sumerlaeia bacterium]